MLFRSDAGTLTFDGEAFDLARADRASIARLRRKTAFVFQNYNLFRNKTALQNVTEGLIVARKMPKNEANEATFSADSAVPARASTALRATRWVCAQRLSTRSH